MELVEALSESPPVWKESDDRIDYLKTRAFAFEIHLLTFLEVPIRVVAHDYHSGLQRARHRCDHIRQEEMSESDFAKR